jgi:protoheme ferro-lyase
MENRDAFRAAGGDQYHYIAALNARADHVDALRGVVLREADATLQPALRAGASACSG